MLFELRKLFAGLMVLSMFLVIGCSSPSDSDDDDDSGGENVTDPITYELTVDASPIEGGSVDPEGGTYEEGEEVEVTATPTDGWEFTGWSGDRSSSDNPITVTMNEDLKLTAEFSETEAPNFELSVEIEPEEGGLVDPESGTFAEGEEVEITATANDGWKFSDWSGDTTSTENPLTVTMDNDKTIFAEFTAITYDLSVDVEPSEGGAVDPESGTFAEGEEVEITATANDGWKFSGWSGDTTSTENPLTVTMDNDKTIFAEFTVITYDLSVDVEPSEGGTVKPESGTFQKGEEVEISATAADGWSFTGWSGDISSDDNPLTFTMGDDTELTATFEENAKAYSIEIDVDDGTESETVTFGMNQNATTGFDSGLDDEAPPAPPNGAFFAHFVIDGHNLYKDLRPVTKDRTVWEFQFDTGEDSITLSWDLNSTDYAGTLSLVDDPDNPSTTIDMDSESSYEITDSSVDRLFIVQE